MSPEQAEGKKQDTRSDIFTFGVVLYEMLTGQFAFHAPTTLSTLASVLRDDPRPMAGPHQRVHDMVVFECLEAPRAAPLGRRILHSCFHTRVLASYFNIRVFPVSPKTRTAYCASRRLRM